MNIKQAKVEDAETLAKIHIESWQAAYLEIIPDEILLNLNKEKRATQFRSNIINQTEEIYLAEIDDEVVGLIGIGKSRDIDADEAGEIFGIYLSPKFWRKGIGRALINEGEKLLLAKGYSEIILWVWSDPLKL
jgi:ribosomal protein S18 acetylase RimI-like enzyme